MIQTSTFILTFCRHNAEPDVSLRYSAQGVESSSISIDRASQPSIRVQEAADSPPSSSETEAAAGNPQHPLTLPGPRQVTTHTGLPSTNPVTGQRQWRPGVSGPPSGVILLIFSLFI